MPVINDASPSAGFLLCVRNSRRQIIIFFRKGIFFLFILRLSGSSASAQITVTNATLPALGDTLRMAADNNPAGITITPPGLGQVWDFSQLKPELPIMMVFKAASEGNMAANVPGANLLVQPGPGLESYYYVSGSKFELMAQYGPVRGIANFSALIKYNPPLTEKRAPMNFFDINVTSSGVLAGFSRQELPAAFIQSLPVLPDSVRVRIAINRVDAVNASGTLIIPDGSYEVLREKRTQYRETRIDAKIPPLGWLDITDIAIQGGAVGLGVDTTNQYFFFSNDSKEPIAIVNTYGDDGSVNDLLPQQVIFKNRGVAAPLPVQLIYFSGSNNGDINILNWKTASELNSSRYEIERSRDGQHFETAGTVTSANRADGSSYRYDDNISHLYISYIYYRLKMIDIDGRFSYSKIVSINIAERHKKIVVHGSLTSRSVNLITPVSLLAAPLRAEIISQNGMQVKRIMISSTATSIDVTHLAPGKYFIRFIQGGRRIQTEPFIKQ